MVGCLHACRGVDLYGSGTVGLLSWDSGHQAFADKLSLSTFTCALANRPRLAGFSMMLVTFPSFRMQPWPILAIDSLSPT